MFLESYALVRRAASCGLDGNDQPKLYGLKWPCLWKITLRQFQPISSFSERFVLSHPAASVPRLIDRPIRGSCGLC